MPQESLITLSFRGDGALSSCQIKSEGGVFTEITLSEGKNTDEFLLSIETKEAGDQAQQCRYDSLFFMFCRFMAGFDNENFQKQVEVWGKVFGEIGELPKCEVLSDEEEADLLVTSALSMEAVLLKIVSMVTLFQSLMRENVEVFLRMGLFLQYRQYFEENAIERPFAQVNNERLFNQYFKDPKKNASLQQALFDFCQFIRDVSPTPAFCLLEDGCADRFKAQLQAHYDALSKASIKSVSRMAFFASASFLGLGAYCSYLLMSMHRAHYSEVCFDHYDHSACAPYAYGYDGYPGEMTWSAAFWQIFFRGFDPQPQENNPGVRPRF